MAMTGPIAIYAVASGRADQMSFGRLLIANPDLAGRTQENAPLNPLMPRQTFYGGAAHGLPTTKARETRTTIGAGEMALA